MVELIQSVGLGLMLILPLANPLTTMVLFLGLSPGMSRAEQHRQIAQATFYVFLIMLVAFYGGQFIMSSFGISIPGLRIAGGLIVSLIGIHMLFSPQQFDDSMEASAKAAQMRDRDRDRNVNIALVPLAMPSTAGPGTIAMLVSTAAQIEGDTSVSPWVLAVAPTLTFVIVSAIVWACLRCSGVIMHWLGSSGIAAISRLMGFLLVCMGTQFVINGVVDIVAGLPGAGGRS
ncbi:MULTISPECIES: MarC family NAAT transporter [Pseudomonadota]|jgi:multiple antibiotic resistance protein|uniref:MarC family NAAT transporter n=1 Tax=Pseudomonadota TaxID=1224 RepID=UPI001B4E6F9D|nr:MarC family NAAT transporter [Achromobacter xylosoxidans]MBP7655415.1 MarC family NAAT transporter [Pseudoxanthomonas sp.]MCH4578086.1 MarC family NAAT transporter [Achromobacter xylosoxidans]